MDGKRAKERPREGQAIYKMQNATDERRLTYQQSLTSRMLTVDIAKFNGRRPVFNFWSINLQFPTLFVLIGTTLAYGTTWRLSGEHARPITGPGKSPPILLPVC